MFTGTFFWGGGGGGKQLNLFLQRTSKTQVYDADYNLQTSIGTC